MAASIVEKYFSIPRYAKIRVKLTKKYPIMN